MSKQCLLVFNRGNGRIVETVVGYSAAMLTMYVLQKSLTKRQDAMVFDCDTGKIYRYMEGLGRDNFPKVLKPGDEELPYTNAMDYCPGILQAVAEL